MVNHYYTYDANGPVNYFEPLSHIKERQFVVTYSDDRGIPFHLSPEKPESIILKRQDEYLVLFRGVLHPRLCDLLLHSNLKIGILLSANEFKSTPSIENFYYALISTNSDLKPTFKTAIKELYGKDWVLSDPDQIDFIADGPSYVEDYIKLIVTNSLLSF